MVVADALNGPVSSIVETWMKSNSQLIPMIKSNKDVSEIPEKLDNWRTTCKLGNESKHVGLAVDAIKVAETVVINPN